MEHRRGFSIVETTAAIAILSVAVVATAQVLAVCSRQRLVSEQWLAAELETANIQERIAAVPYEQITLPKLQSWELSAQARSILPNGKLQIAITDSPPDEPNSKRVRVAISWAQFASENPADPQGEVPTLHAELTAWRFPAAAEVAP
jgi:prepilin-type N-terminal cleavage/methylation domain-containing protein